MSSHSTPANPSTQDRQDANPSRLLPPSRVQLGTPTQIPYDSGRHIACFRKPCGAVATTGIAQSAGPGSHRTEMAPWSQGLLGLFPLRADHLRNSHRCEFAASSPCRIVRHHMPAHHYRSSDQTRKTTANSRSDAPSAANAAVSTPTGRPGLISREATASLRCGRLTAVAAGNDPIGRSGATLTGLPGGTSQLVWLISIGASSVLVMSSGTTQRLRSFTALFSHLVIGGSIGSHHCSDGYRSPLPPHSILMPLSMVR